MVVFYSRIGGMLLLVLGYGLLSVSYKVGSGVILVDYSIWECCLWSVDLSLIFDACSVLFLSVVCLISGSVLLYCEWYMADEMFKGRFFGLVLLFVGCMCCLIVIPNFFTLLIGWDGLGLTSFLLVVYYHSRSSLEAGMLTSITNRVGDVLILCSLGYLMKEGSWMLYEAGNLYGYLWVVWGVVVAAMTKSAQVPFSAWLPAAMAAPTPVSALVHSSTLVTAGVYVLYRMYGALLVESSALFGLGYLSALTLIIAGGAAMVEVDLKKIVALSTLSQLSMMMFSVSIGLPVVAFFHLLCHAMFKALLFLSVGVVIHMNKGFQDIRALGQGWSQYPVSMSCMVVALSSLCGMPFMSGFYSKDCILEGALLYGPSSMYYMMLIIGLFCTYYYSFRMIFCSFCGVGKMAVCAVKSEESMMVKISYASLVVGASLIGYMLVETMEYFYPWVEVDASDKVGFFIAAVVAYFVYYMITIDMDECLVENKLCFFLGSMGHMKYLSGNVCSMGGMLMSDLVIRVMDKGWLEKVGPQGASEVLGGQFAHYNQRVQSGQYFQVLLTYICIGFSFFFLLYLGS